MTWPTSGTCSHVVAIRGWSLTNLLGILAFHAMLGPPRSVFCGTDVDHATLADIPTTNDYTSSLWWWDLRWKAACYKTHCTHLLLQRSELRTSLKPRPRLRRGSDGLHGPGRSTKYVFVYTRTSLAAFMRNPTLRRPRRQHDRVVVVRVPGGFWLFFQITVDRSP